MFAGLLQGSRSIQRHWRLARLLVLLAFGIFVLDLPVHLVHHLNEVNPECQLLGLSFSLGSSALDDGGPSTVDQTWDELIVPTLMPYVSQSWESAQARAPPPTVQS
jgi:hypothetical protein